MCLCLSAKIARFPVLVNGASTLAAQAAAANDPTILTTPAQAQETGLAGDVATGSSTLWMSKLTPGLTAIGASPTVIAQLQAALIKVSTLGSDLAHPYGASTVAPANAGTAQDTSFGAAIKRVLGLSNFTTKLNPWLIDAPYPYRVLQQSVAKTISNSNSAICTLLNNLNTSAASAGKTLYNYLASTYGTAMTLNQTDLTTLQKLLRAV